MLTFISCAKTMTENTSIITPPVTMPKFIHHAKEIAMMCNTLSKEELGKALHVTNKLAAQNYKRFQSFPTDENIPLPAITSYTGIVFKHINPADFTAEDWHFAQEHLLITSFLYGLLRPLDLIKTYRLEGNIKLPELNGQTLFAYWRPILTDMFIRNIKKEGGILINLASAEMKDLFDWKHISREIQIITPEFYHIYNGKPRTTVIYTKMCRGEMTRYIIKNHINSPEKLKDFNWEGYCYNPEFSQDNRWAFTLAD